MFKRLIIMLIIVGLVLGGVFGFKSFQGIMIKKYMSSMGQQPQTVSTINAQYQEWKGQIGAVGTLRAVRGVDISSEVAGMVEGLYFASGDEVKEGMLLAKLRADDDVAALASLKADAHLADITYRRDYQQLQEKTIAQATADISLANLDKAKAAVDEQEAKIAKKFIRAPFAGRLGIRAIDIGQYISPGALIVTLQALDPIYFDFYLPQQELANIKLQQDVIVKSDLHPDKKFAGKIWALNSKVDTATRNIQLRAQLDNTGNELLPGMYATIIIDLGTSAKYITLPQTVITYNAYGDTVFVVKDGKAEQRFVTVGSTRGDQVAIISGLKGGETVVSAGQLKLQNGTAVKVNNDIIPSNDSNPKPSED